MVELPKLSLDRFSNLDAVLNLRGRFDVVIDHLLHGVKRHVRIDVVLFALAIDHKMFHLKVRSNDNFSRKKINQKNPVRKRAPLHSPHLPRRAAD